MYTAVEDGFSNKHVIQYTHTGILTLIFNEGDFVLNLKHQIEDKKKNRNNSNLKTHK